MSGRLFKRSDDALFSEIGNDVVALHIQRGQCFGMEKVTAAVWSMLDQPRSIGSICDSLVETYDVEPEVCRTEIERLMSILEAEGLVDRV